MDKAPARRNREIHAGLGGANAKPEHHHVVIWTKTRVVRERFAAAGPLQGSKARGGIASSKMADQIVERTSRDNHLEACQGAFLALIFGPGRQPIRNACEVGD